MNFKTSGGRDSYNSMQLSVARRFNSGLTLNSQYTLARSYGNMAGSNEALTAGNPFDFDYDIGYNAFDVRHTYNISALYSLPIGRGRRFLGDASGVAEALLGGWEIGAILNGRSGLPIDVRVVRPDVAYVDASGAVFSTPAAGQVAVVNTPGGGASRNVRRPNLIPGVDPYLKNGTRWLNPAAFATRGVRESHAGPAARARVQSGGCGVRQAHRACPRVEHRGPGRDLQRVQPR